MSESVDQFLRRLSESGLLGAEEVDALRETAGIEESGDDASLSRQLVQSGKLTEYQARRLHEGDVRGLVLGDYTVLDRIGGGGMGEVYRARHKHLDRVVAVKVIRPDALESPDAVERFHREATTAAKLNHTNIVMIHDAGDHDGTHYLVMEYVEGDDLATLVANQQRLPVEVAVDYIRQAAAGLEAAHRQAVIHRDIKPANLLVDQQGTVKVLDMGLARVLDKGGPVDVTTRHLTQTGQVMGTVDYMAPEQAEDTRQADERSDIYALGCTLYVLLTGAPPYDADSLVKVLIAHREAAVPPLREKRDDVPESLDAVYQKMLAKRPADRYQSMGEVIQALTACQIEILVQSGRPLPPELAARGLSSRFTPQPPPGDARGQQTTVVVAEATVVEEPPESHPPHPAPPAESGYARRTPPVGPTFMTGLLAGILAVIIGLPLACCGGCLLMSHGCSGTSSPQSGHPSVTVPAETSPPSNGNDGAPD
jgi:serine/threonine protein kinase